MMNTTAVATAALVTFGWSWLPPGPVAYFNRGETHAIATSNVAEIIGILSPVIISQPEWGVLVSAQAWQIRQWAQDADNHGKCLKLTAPVILLGDEYSGGNCR